jgi:hypothetical protein
MNRILRNIYKKQHGARPCVEKMQLIFFVPPNEELEITPPKMKVKGYMYPQMKKPVGMLYQVLVVAMSVNRSG